MYNQYVKEYITEVGVMKFTYTYKTVNNIQSLDDLYISINGTGVWVELRYIPEAWKHQTSKTIIRKVCQMLKENKSGHLPEP